MRSLCVIVVTSQQPRSRIELNSVVPTDVTAFRAGTTVSVYLLPAFQQQRPQQRQQQDEEKPGNNRQRRADDASQSISASAAADLLGEALVSGGGSGTLSIFSNDTSIQVDIVSSDAAISKHPNARQPQPRRTRSTCSQAQARRARFTRKTQHVRCFTARVVKVEERGGH